MEQHPERAYETPASDQTADGAQPLVLGMSSNMSFAAGGLVTVNVMISQGASQDGSSDFVMSASQASGDEAITPLALSGDGGYTAGQALTIDLVVDNDGTARTLTATLPASQVVVDTQPTFQLLNGAGTESLSGAVHLGNGGEASITLDLSSDSALGSGAIEFTLSCGPTSSVERTNVTYLQGRSAYTEDEAYLLQVGYLDDTGAPQHYSLRAPAAQATPGGYYTKPMEKG